MAMITNAVNIFRDCFQHSSFTCRILVKGDVPIGEAAHITLLQIDKESNEISNNEDMVKQLRDQNEKLKNSVYVNPTFRWIVRIIAGLSVLAFLVMIALGFQGEMSEPQTRLFEVCNDTLKVGLAAIAGLIGGKIS